MKYEFKPLIKEQEDRLLSIPELSDGFDPSLEPGAGTMIPSSFLTPQVPDGTYAIHVSLQATADIPRLFLFTGRKILRDVISLKQGEKYEQTFCQSVAEIIPRYHQSVYPVQNLFFTFCADDPQAIRPGCCYGEPADGIPVIYLCGDSTVTDHSSEIPYDPGACYGAWGQALPAFLAGSAAVENQAHCGLTTETFRSEGHMDIVRRHIRPGDFCLIQFGHNDQKLPHLLAHREYPANLMRYAEEIKAAGATPIFVTSPGRNIWNQDGTYLELLGEHTAAVKDVAQETGCPCIDLHDFTVGFLKRHGMEASCGYFHPGDYTHNNDYGAYLLASFVARELHRLYPDLFSYKSGQAKFTPPAHLWETLEKNDHRPKGAEQKEQFDAMEKSTSALLEALRQAKGGPQGI